jgi:hypothetical protein
MTDPQARARVWTLCFAALVLCALTSPRAALLAPLAHASSTALHVVAAVLALTLVGAYVALAALLIVAVLRVVRPLFGGTCACSLHPADNLAGTDSIASRDVPRQGTENSAACPPSRPCRGEFCIMRRARAAILLRDRG